MSEINCNIIRDLLPSYVDEICSEDSRLLVEEHLAGCEQCRVQLEMIKSTDLTDEQGEPKRISYLKKVKKEISSLIFLTLIMISGFLFMVHHCKIMENSLFYIILPLLLTTAYCLLPGSPLSVKRTKLSVIFIMISILLLVYFSVLVYWGIQIGRTGSGLFGIPLEKIGPFLYRQLMFIIALQLGIFILSNILTFYGYWVNKWLYGLAITGAYLSVGYICLLHNMSTVETFTQLLLKMTGYLILEGIVFSVAARIIVNKRRYN